MAKIYIVHTDAWEGDKPFNEITNEEIEEMYDAGNEHMFLHHS